MRKDTNLIFAILKVLEKNHPENEIPKVLILGQDQSIVNGHLRMLYNAGFITGIIDKNPTRPHLYDIYPCDLTWEGHDYLDSLRCKEKVIDRHKKYMNPFKDEKLNEKE